MNYRVPIAPYGVPRRHAHPSEDDDRVARSPKVHTSASSVVVLRTPYSVRRYLGNSGNRKGLNNLSVLYPQAYMMMRYVP